MPSRSGEFQLSAVRLSPTRYGETIIWDGQRLHRYPARMKDQARRRQTSTITRAGFDAGLVSEDDNEEITRLTLWSLRQMEAAVSQKRPGLVAKAADSPPGEVVELHKGLADKSLPEVRNPVTRERTVLPVVSFESVATTEVDKDGAQTIGERLVPRLASTSQRQCNTCVVKATCPAMQENHACAFDLPVRIETKDQLLAVLNAVIEMQTQRVLFGRFAEELAGGYPNQDLSAEIERLFKLVTAIKKLEDTNAFLRVSVEASAGAGVLSRIFGERATQLRELPGAVDADSVITGVLGGLDN